jgi:hypothetical protein
VTAPLPILQTSRFFVLATAPTVDHDLITSKWQMVRVRVAVASRWDRCGRSAILAVDGSPSQNDVLARQSVYVGSPSKARRKPSI